MNETWPQQPRDNHSTQLPEQPTEDLGQASPPPPPPYQPGYGSEPAAPAPQPRPKPAPRFGWPALITSVAMAAILGGGAGGLAVNCLGSRSVATSQELR